MIRPALIAELLKTLGLRAEFCSDDFEIVTGKQGNFSTVTIVFRSNAQYSIRANIPTAGHLLGFEIKGVVSPGLISEAENFEVSSWAEFLSACTAWMGRIHGELLAIPMYRRQVEQQGKLQELMENVATLPDEYFSAHEAEELRRRLEDLEAKLAEQIKSSEQDAKAVTARLDAIHKDFEWLKNHLDSLKKPGWVKGLIIRTTSWTKDPANRPLINSGTEIVKALLEAHQSNH